MIKFLKIFLTITLLIGLIFGGKSVYDKLMGEKDYDEARMLLSTPKKTTAPAAEPTAVPAAVVTDEALIADADFKEEDMNTGSSIENTSAQSAAGTEETDAHSDPVVNELLTYNLDALREVNPDVFGWLHIPGTRISYPLVKGEDNDFYLNHTWKKEANTVGSIFLEAQNKADMTDFNTIIYGHNMDNNSMFRDLLKFDNLKFMKENPSAYVVTDNGVYRYDFFSAHKASVKSITYAMDVQTDRKKNEVIQFNLNYADVKTDYVPTVDDQLLTLSTCSRYGQTVRWVVVGVFNAEGSCLVEPLK